MQDGEMLIITFLELLTKYNLMVLIPNEIGWIRKAGQYFSKLRFGIGYIGRILSWERSPMTSGKLVKD